MALKRVALEPNRVELRAFRTGELELQQHTDARFAVRLKHTAIRVAVALRRVVRVVHAAQVRAAAFPGARVRIVCAHVRCT